MPSSSQAPRADACPVCSAPMVAGLCDWHRRCRRCAYEASTLQPRILEQAGDGLDEAARAEALAPLRRRNFARLAGLIAAVRGGDAATGAASAPRPRLLDVGCAHGWFLEQMGTRFAAEGIEPDAAVANTARARGLAVRDGFFPEALAADESWDVIVFNDVLEHIPDVDAALAACRRHLRPGGLLVVNAPDRRGALYRTAKALLRLRRPGAFARMWQLGFPSPHVHYFDDASLRALTARHGLRPVARTRLASVGLAGLHARVRYSRDVPAAKALVITAAVAVAIPVLALLPADIGAWIFRRDFDDRGGAH